MNLFRSQPARALGIFSLALVIALSMIVVAGNYSASQSSGTSVTTCYNKKTGAMRYLVKGICKKSETTLSLSQVGAQGPVGATGSSGATGAQGATGASGFSAGLSVSDIHDDSDVAYRPTVLITDGSQGFFPTLILRTGDVSSSGAQSSSQLSLTSNKLVQISATLIFSQVNGDNAVQEMGKINCNIFHGQMGTNISSFQYVTGSNGIIDISETSINSGFYGSLALNGWIETSGDKEFAVKCIRFGVNPSDVRLSESTLNAIAVG